MTGQRNRSAFGRVVAWIAAYAFILQTVIAPIAAAARVSVADAALSAICAEHAPATNPDSPAGNPDHDSACKLCVACASVALLAPEIPSAAIRQAAVTLRWHATSYPVASKSWLAGKQARGPPSLT